MEPEKKGGFPAAAVAIVAGVAVLMLVAGGAVGVFVGNSRGYTNGLAAGASEGHKSGYEAGFADGKRQSASDSYERGKAEGFELGLAEAMKRGYQSKTTEAQVICKETVNIEAGNGIYEEFTVPEDSVAIEINASVTGNALKFYIINEQNWEFRGKGMSYEAIFGSTALETKEYGYYGELLPGKTYYFLVMDYDYGWFTSHAKSSAVAYTITSYRESYRYVEYANLSLPEGYAPESYEEE